MSDGYSQEGLQLSISTPLGDDAVLLRALTGTEELSRPFAVDMDLVSERDDLDLESALGASACVTIARTGGQGARYIHGVLTRLVQIGTDARFTRYRMEMRPWLWLLNFTRDSRIFQDQSVPEILESVFAELGFNDFRNACSGQYAKREYCVQYRESVFDFVSRLMEDEGIYYFFEHSDSAHTLVFADDQDGYATSVGVDSVSYRRRPSDAPAASDILTAELDVRYTSVKFEADDFDFENPKTDLRVTGGSGEAVRAVFEYPGGFATTSVGETRARVRLEELEHGSRRLNGESAVYGFSPGHRFTLSDHPRADVNDEYVLRAVTHSATHNTYINRFDAFPLDLPFRPPRITHKPRIPGSQTAIVVGKAGEEIWTDAYGRVKVRFHWDRASNDDEEASCFVRVSQAWAGKQWGAMQIPRIGQEVLVGFLEGDPDRPVITGRVYNGETMPPYELPANQTISTTKSNSTKGGEGFNELRFDDKKDEEQLFVHAQKNMDIQVLNDRFETIGNERHLSVETNKFEHVKADRSETVDGNHNEEIAGDRNVKVTGKQAHEVGGTLSLKVTGKVSEEFAADHSEETTGDITLTAANVVIEATSNITIKVGDSYIAIEQGGIGISASGTLEMNSSGDMTLDSGANLSAEGGQAATLKGGTGLTAESSGETTIKGSMVKIN
jgi:type VI secretion system secreted protein VgrG